VVRRNYLLAAATGNIIPRIAAERLTGTAPQPIVSAAQLVVTLSPTGKPALETKSVAKVEILPAIVVELASATA
jgi:hypothetical protein